MQKGLEEEAIPAGEIGQERGESHPGHMKRRYRMAGVERGVQCRPVEQHSTGGKGGQRWCDGETKT